MFFFQTWLDERLFGWSRSAKHGTSAWAGGTRSTEISRQPSRAATPDTSSDEEGDYDNILGVVEKGASRSRSRQNSYADLQKLRKSSNAGHSAGAPVRVSGEELRFTPMVKSPTVPSGANNAANGEGLHVRHRKPSLSGRVPVERISALDRKEDFEAATVEINNEIQEQKANGKTHQE